MVSSESGSVVPDVAAVAREVEEFVGTGGWDQPPQLFALVPTAELLRQQPELAGQLGGADGVVDENALTPVAQDSLPEGDLAEALARIAWPETVRGCAIAQEIIVLPPGAEAELPAADSFGDDAASLRRAAADHPRRTEARLVAAVVRDGAAACVLRLRGETRTDGDAVDETIENPELAPNLVEALRATLQP